jgi:hypothetical protein
LALAVSVSAHVLALWLMLGQHGMGGTLAIGRDMSGEGEGAMEVSLVGPANQAQAAQDAPAIDHAQSLLERLQGQDGGAPAVSEPAVTTNRPRTSLSDLFDEPAPSRPTGGGRAPAKTPGGSAASSPADASAPAGGSAGSAGGAAAGSLWGAVEPCWRGVGAPPGVIVSLQIDLDLAGHLKSPPRILRRPDLPVRREQLVAEADALQALATCLPRANKKFTGVFMLDFKGKGGSAAVK